MKKKRPLMNDEDIVRAAMTLIGSRRSERKAEAARKNGRLGGVPKRFKPCPSGKPHRWGKDDHCRFCYQKKEALQLRQAK